MSGLLDSGGESAILIGDVAHLCIQLSESVVTSWRSGSRNVAFSSPRVIEEAVGRNAVMAGPHLDEGPVFGRMVMLNGRLSGKVST